MFCNIPVLVGLARRSRYRVVTAPFMPAPCHPGSRIMFLSRCTTATGIDFSGPSWKWYRQRHFFGPLHPARMHSRPSPRRVRDVLRVGKLLSYNISCQRNRSERLLAVWHRWVLCPHIRTIFAIFNFFIHCSDSCNARTVRDHFFITCCIQRLLIFLLCFGLSISESALLLKKGRLTF